MTDNVEWWLDEASLPNLVWARLEGRAGGSAELLHADGHTRRFNSVLDAHHALAEDGYLRPQSLERDELAKLGMLERELAAPSAERADVLGQMSRVLECADAMRDLAAVNWQRPWTLLSPVEHDLFLDELSRELDVTHPLHGRQARPFLRRLDRDDVLYVMSGPVQLVVVHLTFTTAPPERPPSPSSIIYDRVWEFVDQTHRDADGTAIG